jgi:RHS repeat-associated protein
MNYTDRSEAGLLRKDDLEPSFSESFGYTAGGSPIAAEQLEFGYDPGWNMTNRRVNGTSTLYSANDLNEVTSGGLGSFTYDANGNRTVQGWVIYTYDDENRLVQISDDTYHTYRTVFVYDGLGRMRKRIDYYWGGSPTAPEGPGGPLVISSWCTTNTVLYIYDGSRVIEERNTNNVPTVSYTRGPDLSGTLEGAGGIGGLLARSYGYSGGTWTTHNFYHADGNGNITYLADGSQAQAACYKYDPYGRTITSSGPQAAANLYRFSSKETHPGSGMYYYLYRFYDPSLQRWLNRDPLLEPGFEVLRADARGVTSTRPSRAEGASGPNICAFVANDPIDLSDRFGLQFHGLPWPGTAFPGGPGTPHDQCDPKPVCHTICDLLDGGCWALCGLVEGGSRAKIAACYAACSLINNQCHRTCDKLPVAPPSPGWPPPIYNPNIKPLEIDR